MSTLSDPGSQPPTQTGVRSTLSDPRTEPQAELQTQPQQQQQPSQQSHYSQHGWSSAAAFAARDGPGGRTTMTNTLDVPGGRTGMTPIRNALDDAATNLHASLEPPPRMTNTNTSEDAAADVDASLEGETPGGLHWVRRCRSTLSKPS